MKLKFLLALVLAISGAVQVQAQMPTHKSERNQNQIADRLALKGLVDTFSNLADVKDVDSQMQLFTEDAEVVSVAGERITQLKGKKQIGEAFSAYLALFHTVYHLNGQQTVEIDGDTAKGTAYCQVVLIGSQDGKDVMTTQGVIYNDTYVKRGGKWFIAHRKSNFVWRDVREVGK